MQAQANLLDSGQSVCVVFPSALQLRIAQQDINAQHYHDSLLRIPRRLAVGPDALLDGHGNLFDEREHSTVNLGRLRQSNATRILFADSPVTESNAVWGMHIDMQATFKDRAWLRAPEAHVPGASNPWDKLSSDPEDDMIMPFYVVKTSDCGSSVHLHETRANASDGVTDLHLRDVTILRGQVNWKVLLQELQEWSKDNPRVQSMDFSKLDDPMVKKTIRTVHVYCMRVVWENVFKDGLDRKDDYMSQCVARNIKVQKAFSNSLDLDCLCAIEPCFLNGRKGLETLDVELRLSCSDEAGSRFLQDKARMLSETLGIRRMHVEPRKDSMTFEECHARFYPQGLKWLGWTHCVWPGMWPMEVWQTCEYHNFFHLQTSTHCAQQLELASVVMEVDDLQADVEDTGLFDHLLQMTE